MFYVGLILTGLITYLVSNVVYRYSNNKRTWYWYVIVGIIYWGLVVPCIYYL
jgi:hypothetical protein